jgi:hypothetical protein
MSVKKILSQQVDRMVLYAINWRIPDGGTERFECKVTLEDVLAETHVREGKTPPYQLTAPGEHAIYLDTMMGEIKCRVTVRPAAQADAPLVLYHHGLAEYPYTSTWRRLVPRNELFPAHTVAVQAPYHTNLSDPIRVGFSSTEHIYQMFAGSLRIMELVQEQFEREGAAFTLASGLSWGGITSLLYEGLFDSTRAVIPMFASPRLSQAIWDASQLLGRPLPVSRQRLDELLDFTPIYQRIDQGRVFPVMGEDDLFFQFENHALVYDEDSLVTLPMTHVGAMWLRNGLLRKHVLDVLAWAAEHPCR